MCSTWMACGKANGVVDCSSFDLVNVPEKHTRYVNFYRMRDKDGVRDWQCRCFSSKHQAAYFSSPDCVASVPVEFTEGEGLP